MLMNFKIPYCWNIHSRYKYRYNEIVHTYVYIMYASVVLHSTYAHKMQNMY